MLKFVTGWLLLITMNTQATDWPLYGLGHDNRRFSGLRQINRDNVAALEEFRRLATTALQSSVFCVANA